MENLGPRIREIRNRKGMTLETVATKADISASSLSYIERGQNSPTAETLRKIADALGVTMGELLGAQPEADRDVRTADAINRMPSELAGLARGTWWLDLEPEDRQEIANFIEWKLSQIRKEKQRKERK